MQKKKILIHSNHCKMFTGFGKHKKNLLSYLYKTGKYELIELSNSLTWSSDATKLTPWKCVGSLPDDQELIREIQKDPKRSQMLAYGSESIDKAIDEFKPDIYLGIEDIWGFNGYFEKPWWNKVNCIIHTTLDSLPILPDAVVAASKIKHYFVWASFAEKALHELGHNHVKTVRGSLDVDNFYKLPSDQVQKIRKVFNLDDSFIIGFVFRNQLRKSVPNLLDGFKLFCANNPSVKAKLLLHTHWAEGWDISRLLKEKNIESEKVLTTYFCKNCHNYHINSFVGNGINCPFCKAVKTCETTNIKNGVNEQQLNQIYNLMDVYCHPFTSGGQEIPVQEAKLTELITLVTNYSCGEDCCSPESGGLPLEWAEYREPGTQFIKASTLPKSIAEQLQKVYDMPLQDRILIGKKARNFVLENFSIEIIGKYFENLFDSLPYVDYSQIKLTERERNINFVPDESLPDKEWIESLYSNILAKIDPAGVEHWIQRLKTDLKRSDILAYFIKVATVENNSITQEKMVNSLSKEDDGKRIAFVMPENEEDVIISSALLPSIKQEYPDHNIYYFTKPQYFDLISSNKFVHKILNYCDKMDDPYFFEGRGNQKKYFEFAYIPYLETRKYLNFTKNNKDKIQFDVYEHI
jgi:glycosyltransferase involved in cell wall biosynthesis